MRHGFLAAALFGSVAALAAGGASSRAEGPTALPASVAADLADVAAQCSEVGGKPLTADAVKRADLNADGHEDFVLDVGSISCDGAFSIYGDRQKGVSVYVGDGQGNAALAFDETVFGASLEGAGPAAKLWLTVSGQQCGKPPAPDFAHENFCDRALAWDPKTERFDYAALSTVRMIE